MTTFDDRIIALKNEVEALKAAKRKSSLVLSTITKTCTATAQLYKTDHDVIICTKAALISIERSDDDNPLLFSWSMPGYSSRGRNVDAIAWTDADGADGLLLVPYSSSADAGMARNSYKNITLTAYITATGDFTASSTQVNYEEAA